MGESNAGLVCFLWDTRRVARAEKEGMQCDVLGDEISRSINAKFSKTVYVAR